MIASTLDTARDVKCFGPGSDSGIWIQLFNFNRELEETIHNAEETTEDIPIFQRYYWFANCLLEKLTDLNSMLYIFLLYESLCGIESKYRLS